MGNNRGDESCKCKFYITNWNWNFFLNSTNISNFFLMVEIYAAEAIILLFTSQEYSN